MLENGNNFINAIQENSDAGKDITKNEWDKINKDKDQILSKVSNEEYKTKLESKYQELDNKFNESSNYIHNTTENEINLFKNTFLLDRFGAGEEIKDSISDLNKIGLDINKLLSGYDKYIETELKTLPKEIKEKIKNAIGIRLSKIPTILQEIKQDSQERGVTLKSQRWEANNQITDLLNDIGLKILPSAKFLTLSKEEVNKGLNHYGELPGVVKSGPNITGNNGLQEEIQEMFQANLNEKGNFDEGFFSRQDKVLNLSGENGQEVAQHYGIDKKIDINLLNETDVETEKNYLLKYLATILPMVAPYAGAGISLPSDFTDAFTNQEGISTVMKNIPGLLNENEMEYTMPKHWIDNVFGIIGIIGTATGLQGVAKSPKFAKIITKLGKLGIGADDVMKLIGDKIKGFENNSNVKNINKQGVQNNNGEKTDNINSNEKIDNLTPSQKIENSPKLRDGLFKQEFSDYIDNLVKETAKLKNPETGKDVIPESAQIGEKAKELMFNMIEDTNNISTDLLKLIGKIKTEINGNLQGMSLRSLTHILESISNSPKIPSNKLIDQKLEKEFPGVTASEYFGFVTVFHDLIKNTLPTQVVEFISKDKWGKLSTVNGGQLSSHQLESANNLRNVLEQKDNSKIYSALKEFLDSKGLPEEKLPEFVESIAKTIEGHAGNTEFIQVDTARSILNLRKNINNEFNKIKGGFNEYQESLDGLLKGMKENNIINEADIKEINKKFVGLEDPIRIKELINKVAVKRFIKNNVGTDLELKDIKLDELDSLSNTLSTKTAKVAEIQNLLDTGYSQEKIEGIIDGKIKFLEENSDLMNKYLHKSKYENGGEEAMRFAFNINDIVEYGNPNSEGFTKLIMFNNIGDLISSPMNSSLALLAELKLALNTKPDLVNVEKFTKMYENGINNMQKLSDAYSKKLASPLSDKAPDYIKELGGNTFGEAYDNAKNSEKISEDVLAYFRNEFKDMCLNTSTKEVYPATSKMNPDTLKDNILSNINKESIANPELVNEIAKLPDNKRLEIAGKLLGRELNNAEKTRILNAHNVEGKGVYNYTSGEKTNKGLKLMKGDGAFSRDEAQKLLDFGVAGKALSPDELKAMQVFSKIDIENLHINNAKEITETIQSSIYDLSNEGINQYKTLIESLPKEFIDISANNGYDLKNILNRLNNQEKVLQYYSNENKLNEVFNKNLSNLEVEMILKNKNDILKKVNIISQRIENGKPINKAILSELGVNDGSIPLQIIAKYSDKHGGEVRNLLQKRIKKIKEIIEAPKKENINDLKIDENKIIENAGYEDIYNVKTELKNINQPELDDKIINKLLKIKDQVWDKANDGTELPHLLSINPERNKIIEELKNLNNPPANDFDYLAKVGLI